MIPAAGWFTKDVYGDKGAEAAFLIVQHAVNDVGLMRTTLARLEPLSRQDPFYGRQYALMYDRIALEIDHKPQRYGSQVTCKAGKWRIMELEDPAHVDARRKAVGLEDTEADYLKGFGDGPCS